MNKQLLLDNLRCIPDWPIKGVNFRDVTTLFKDKDALREIADSMYDLYKDKGITKIVGIESRGFVMSSAVAIRLNAGVVLCRKPGKLPCATIQESYAKEYGIDTIEIHADSINKKMSCYFTTTCWLQEARWLPPASSSRSFTQRRFTATSSSI